MPDEIKKELPATTEEVENAELDITNEDAADSKLDTVVDLLSSLSFPIWVVRNASKAFRQLCSAAVEWPVAYFEGKAAEIRAGTDARIKIIGENTDQIAQQMQVDPEYARIAVNKYGQKILREQVNLDKISVIAADELKKTIAAETTKQSTDEPNKEVSAEETNQGTNKNEETTINDDWLNNFENEARQVSTEDMQRRFGRVLAGEIEKPGSYSTKAVKILGGMDQNIAALFKKLCSVAVIMEVQDDGSILEVSVPSLLLRSFEIMLNDGAAHNVLSKYGLGFDQLNLLNEHDLILSGYNLWRTYQVFENSENKQGSLRLLHQGEYWDLLPLPDHNENQKLQLPGVVFSHTGRELLSIVDQDSMPEYTENLKQFIAKQKIQMVESSIQ